MGYLRFVRRQHVNIQHAHAFFFAFIITMFIAVAILYFEYGFFRTKYDKSMVVYEEQIKDETLESPSEMMGRLLWEAKDKMNNIKSGSANLLEGTEKFER